MSAAPRPTAAPGREQGHEFALEPLDFRGRHDHGRTAIDGVDDGDRFQVAVLDEGGRDAVGDPQPIRERDGAIATDAAATKNPRQRWRGFLSFRIRPIYAPTKVGDVLVGDVLWSALHTHTVGIIKSTRW